MNSIFHPLSCPDGRDQHKFSGHHHTPDDWRYLVHSCVVDYYPQDNYLNLFYSVTGKFTGFSVWLLFGTYLFVNFHI